MTLCTTVLHYDRSYDFYAAFRVNNQVKRMLTFPPCEYALLMLLILTYAHYILALPTWNEIDFDWLRDGVHKRNSLALLIYHDRYIWQDQHCLFCLANRLTFHLLFILQVFHYASPEILNEASGNQDNYSYDRRYYNFHSIDRFNIPISMR